MADVIVIINGTHTFHLEAQMTKDDRIVLRVFEYEFFYAISQWDETNTLEFPEPMVIYLDNQPGIPEESILHISFGSQGTFDYKVQNYMYLEHDVTELNRRKMMVLIPFQLLKLRSLIHQIIPSGQEGITSLTLEDMGKINLLQQQLKNDIICPEVASRRDDGVLRAYLEQMFMILEVSKQMFSSATLPWMMQSNYWN